ncbi:alkylmercury lyase family protein [Nonomuraea sp. NPDC059023]|uniref:alkylmercury lyase family protein n=1 Tax=unclassified Nonomuraea TaxID=2593643 RepID=UPI00367C70C9
MEIVLVSVPGCPNAPVLADRLARAMAEVGVADTVLRRTVSTDEEARRWGLRGSPMLLVDGFDPFGVAGMPISMSCRLQKVPSVAELRQALRRTSAMVWSDALGRAGAGRRAPVDGGLRAVQQRVLRSFAGTGTALSRAELPQQALTALHEADFLRLDEHGEIRAAYPFSAVPTPHRVQIVGGPQVYAMCAIDALGMAAMLGRDIRLESADPVTGRPIIVEVSGDGAVWSPRTAVVFAGQQATCCAVAAADACCGSINFFTDARTAQSWVDAHPDVEGRILGQQEAFELGVAIFGSLLDP